VAHSQTVDRGENLWIQTVAKNALNKQSQTADMGQFSTFRVRQGANNQNLGCYKMLQRKESEHVSWIHLDQDKD
jgi:hypothetical protein